MKATAGQIAAIHASAKRAGLSDAARRDLMAAATGKRSAKDMTAEEAGWVLAALARLAGGARSPAATASGKWAPVLRALWLSAYHLGLARSRDDRALIAFVQRQTKVTHTRFLTEDDADLADAAIHGLRGWMAREAGVVWPPRGGATANRIAVVEAQWRRLAGCGAVQADRLDAFAARALRSNDWRAAAAPDLDRLIRALGTKLHAALALESAAP